jgi:hypothetical protein
MLAFGPYLGFRFLCYSDPYLEAHPGSYEVVRRVLAHQPMRTTTRAYTGLETRAAARHFDETILKLRGGTAPGGRR